MALVPSTPPPGVAAADDLPPEAQGFGITAAKRARAARKLAPLVTLDNDLQRYIGAFWFLHRLRSYSGFGFPSGIPFSELRAWLDEFGVEGEERRRYIRFISALDAEFIKTSAAELSDRNKTGAAEEAKRKAAEQNPRGGQRRGAGNG